MERQKAIQLTDVANSATPFFDHQFAPCKALIIWSEYLFNLGLKLSSTANKSQTEKYNGLTNAYIQIRKSLSQNFIHEVTISQLEHRLLKLAKENSELKCENEKLKQTLNFN